MLKIGQVRLELPPLRGLLEGPAPDVVAHVLGPDDQDVLPPHEGTVVARLDRATRRERPVEQAAVGREQVDVELLGVERPDERVARERQVPADLLLAVPDHLVELGLEEVAGGEVPSRMAARIALGQRARLPDLVLAPLIGERGVGPARRDAELPEHA